MQAQEDEGRSDGVAEGVVGGQGGKCQMAADRREMKIDDGLRIAALEVLV